VTQQITTRPAIGISGKGGASPFEAQQDIKLAREPYRPATESPLSCFAPLPIPVVNPSVLYSSVLHPSVLHPSVLHPSVHSRAKRLLDVLGASVGLVITSVVALPLALAIYLDDPGPIFYSQLRCGFRGRTFRIWKFRTMLTNADQLKHLVKNEAKGNLFKSASDPRITRVGRFLRRTSLDELPQFLNVLEGDMSLVGTRPPTLDEVIRYKRHHWLRLDVKPGLTGEWQAHGRSAIQDFEKVVALDVRYQSKWSVRYDLYLVMKTVFSVFTRAGAY
jgi:lipopolysaccharide/colanic/teichoic acid biosynthesis glycosyltransferase